MWYKKLHPKQFEIIAIVMFFLGTLFLYLHNITRDVYSGDIGDLVSASYFFGVPHPPGYPLFSLLGFLFSHLPIVLPTVSKVALVSTVSSLIGLLTYYLFSYKVSKNTFISLLSASILAFSYLFWFHAEIPEAFALNNMFVILLLYVGFLFYTKPKKKYLYLLSFLIGLSLTHHHTITLLFPALFLLIVRRIRFLFSDKKIILCALGVFILGLVPYIYVPLAASRHPIINWDDASTFKNFIYLLLRKDYGGFAPDIAKSEIPVLAKLTVLQDYKNTFVSTFSYQILFVFLLGIVELFKKNKWLLFALLTAFILSGPFFIYYAASLYTTVSAVGVIERFYSLSFVVATFFIPFGFLCIQKFLDKRFSKTFYSIILLSYFIIVPFYLLRYNYERTNLSTTHIGNNLALDILSSVPKNAIVYITGDTTTFNMWYVHYVLNNRTDAGLINPPGVGGNKFLEDKVNDYHKKNPDIKVSNLLTETLEDLRKTRRIFATYEIDYRPPGTILLPWGMVYELMSLDNVPDEQTYLEKVEVTLQKLHKPRRETLMVAEKNLVATEIPTIYSNALVRIGDFVASYYKDPAKSEHYYRRALWMDNQNPAAYAGLALSQYKGYHDCTNSLENMKSAIENYRIWKLYYAQLYVLYKNCHTDKKIVDQFKNQYYNTFKRTIEDDLSEITKKNLP